MDGKWIAFGHSEGSSYFYSRGYLKYLMVEYRLFPVFIIKIRICVQIVNTGIFAKLKDKGYLNTAPAVLELGEGIICLLLYIPSKIVCIRTFV